MKREIKLPDKDFARSVEFKSIALGGLDGQFEGLYDESNVASHEAQGDESPDGDCNDDENSAFNGR